MERAPRVDKVRDLPRSAHVGPVRELVPHFVTPSAHSNWYCSGAETELIVNISLLSDSSASVAGSRQPLPSCSYIGAVKTGLSRGGY